MVAYMRPLSEGWDTGYRRASYILIQMAFDGSLESSALAL